MPGKVFVTGAAGFIGGQLCRSLPRRGYTAVADRTRMPDSDLHGILRAEAPDWLIHCAGPSSVPGSISHPEADFRDNVLATESLFEALAASSPRTRVVFLSSAAVYGEPEVTPIREDAATRPVSPYGFHKLIAETIARKHSALSGIPVTILRVFSAYGPGLRRQVLWDICESAARGPVVELYGTGKETRDFIYVDDLVEAVDHVLRNSPFDAGVVNVASGVSTSIAHLAATVVKAFGGTHAVRFRNEPRSGDPLHWEVDVATLRDLGMTSFIPIEEGAARYVEWWHSLNR